MTQADVFNSRLEAVPHITLGMASEYISYFWTWLVMSTCYRYPVASFCSDDTEAFLEWDLRWRTALQFSLACACSVMTCALKLECRSHFKWCHDKRNFLLVYTSSKHRISDHKRPFRHTILVRTSSRFLAFSSSEMAVFAEVRSVC